VPATVTINQVNKLFFQLLLLACLLAGCASPHPSAIDLGGKSTNPLAETNAATVLIFISNDCPISNRYAPELQRLHDLYTPRGVNFWLVHADATETTAAIREHARAYSLTIPELRDPHQQLARLSHATVTPTAAIFTPGAKLVYHGRIDDRVADLGRERAHAVQHDLADALDAILSGQRVPASTTEAIGCNIPGTR
jgi:AhpC/TSA family